MWVGVPGHSHTPSCETRSVAVAASSRQEMARTKTRARAARREADREKLDRAAELYLQTCYRTRTAARVDEFAEYLRRARPHVSRIVPEVIGMPVRDFLREKQLGHAQALLRTTPASVEQIALASGFGTGWTFYRCFKAAFGMTPTEYRTHVTKWE